MHNAAWAALLRHIPEDRQNQLMLVTAAGTEIAVQSILRVDHEFMAIKGRLAGSQDAGRLFFIPFRQIDNLGFVCQVKESEYQEMFGGLAVPAPQEAGGDSAFLPPPEPEAPAEYLPGSSSRPSIRSEVLDRYRSSRPTSSLSLPRVARNGEPG